MPASKSKEVNEPGDSSPYLPLGINNTRLRRFAVLTAIHALKHIRPQKGSVLFLSQRLCVKHSPLRPLSEANTLRFVAEHTSIPVPKVHCAFVHSGVTYILMDKIDGEMLADVWTSRSVESKAKILSQLKKMVDELRALRAPGPGVMGVDGGPLFDCRFPGTSMTIGPFKTIHDFHSCLRSGVQVHPDLFPDVNKMIGLQDRPWPMPVLTHGDLSSLNILVRGDEVVGIVDWETAGWYPSYWEYSMAWHVNPRNSFWREEVDRFLDPMPVELEMEQIRLKYFGDV